jgi:hypothetical protein
VSGTYGLVHADVDCTVNLGCEVSIIRESMIECVAEVWSECLGDPMGVRGIH